MRVDPNILERAYFGLFCKGKGQMPEKVTSVGSINSFKNAYDDFISK